MRCSSAVLGLALGLGLLSSAMCANAVDVVDAIDAVDALVSAAEQALALGDTATAQAGFERAAALRHEANIEMGLVRTAMQAGAYREALAFCAHTAGDHLDEPAGSALYAWLLRIGGQEALAERVLSDTQTRAPTDAVVQATRHAFDAGLLAPPSGVLLGLPHRVAPQPQMLAEQAAPVPGTRSVASGLLVAGGHHALVPRAALASPADTQSIWLRNGLGQTTEAVVDSAAQTPFAPLGLTLLRLLAPLPVPPAPPQLALHDPFAGSVGYAFAYPSSALPAEATLAWPTLHAGFLGGAAPRSGWRQLGFDLPSGPLGGPVFDAAGRLSGIAMGNAALATMLPVSMWRAPVTALWAAPIESPAAAGFSPVPMPTDEVYERGLKLALQVLVWP